MHRIWKYNVKMDGVILHNDWPLDESLKNHNDTYHILPYYNQVRVGNIPFFFYLQFVITAKPLRII